MKYFYALQTNITMQEIHEKLGFKPWIDCAMSDKFDENEEQIYITSIHRIEDKKICDFTNEELMVELSSRGIDGDEFDQFADDYNNEWGEP